MHRLILHNDDIRDSAERVLSPGQVGLLSGWGVFSTLRVAAGVPFAFERHFARMRRDAELLRVPFPSDPEWMRSRLLRLIEANRASEATLRVVVVRHRGGIWQGPDTGRDFDLIGLLTDLHDWGEGVKLAVHPQARHAGCDFRGVKMLAWALNLAMLEEAQCRGFDEVVLLNERGEVSECTSANIFLARGGTVWTPPLSSGCLPGVTRELLLAEVRTPGFEVIENPFRPEDLESADDVFITSTTRDLLPVLSIDGRPLRRSGNALAALLEAFRRYQDDYIRSRPRGTDAA